LQKVVLLIHKSFRSIVFKIKKTMKIKKVMLSGSQGFTLIELLLVMAIIGILAGTILVGVSGQREKARTGRALETMNAVLPYAVECFITGVAMSAPGTSVNWTGTLCGSISYPALGDGCNYNNTNPSSGSFSAVCGSRSITCDIDDGNCIAN
jgi:prepilin-type N-terminal cleavage/methylation domain-containing protein